MHWNLWLDDLRNPKWSGDDDGYWTWAKSTNEAIHLIEANGLPEVMSLDHDLGYEQGGDTGLDFLKALVQMDMDGLVDITRCEIYIHSANPIGRENMEGLLNSYLNSLR